MAKISADRTQDFVPIKEVRDGIVILKDGGMRAILMASSINLSLKSYEEQRATISQFQNVLNSLEFQTQIVIQSRRYDIRPYLILLEERMKEQTEPLLKIQTREYIEFIRGFNEQVNIMTKNFFVVIPYTSDLSADSASKGFSSLFKKNARGSEDEKKDFEEKRSQLEQRVSIVAQGLNRLGIRTSVLDTEAVVELFYKSFNPGDVTSAIKLQENQ
jgi:type IV secretory pathway VirB4 component